MHHMESGEVDFKTVHRNSPNYGVESGYLAWHLQSLSVGQEFTGSPGVMPRLWRKGALIMAVALAGPFPAWANSSQTIEKQKDICAQATSITERAEGIPSHLLGAISLAETGRWDDKRRASFA
jgi:hypothetical protein